MDDDAWLVHSKRGLGVTCILSDKIKIPKLFLACWERYKHRECPGQRFTLKDEGQGVECVTSSDAASAYIWYRPSIAGKSIEMRAIL